MRRLVLTVQGHSGNWVAFSLTNNSELSVSRYYEHGRILKPRRFFWRPGAHAGCHHESRGHNCPKNDSQDNTAGQSEYDYGRANQCIADNAAKSGRQRPFGVSRPTTRKARRDCYAKHPGAEPQRFAVEITVADHPPTPHCGRQDQRDRPKAEGLHQKIGPDRAGIANDIMDWTRRGVTEVRVLHRPRHERRRDDPG